MTTILDTNNIFEYLSDRNYCALTDRGVSKVTAIPAKNFNLLINFSDDKNTWRVFSSLADPTIG
jgi:hypothetical protein